jgi:hypothetical protein
MAKHEQYPNGLRRRTFWTLALPFSAALLWLDYQNIVDPCLIIYGTASTTSGICGVLFAQWWIHKGNATSVYKWITWLLFATCFNQAVQFWARWTFLKFGREKYAEFILTRFWNYRATPLLFTLFYLLAFGIWQRWGRQSTYSDGIRNDMAEGFRNLEARIVDGEIRFLEHSHEGLILDAKIILRSERMEKE